VALIAPLVVDAHKDSVSKGGKLWPRVREIAEAVNCFSNTRYVLHSSRAAGLQAVFAPHHAWREGKITARKYLARTESRGYQACPFEDGACGEEFHPDLQTPVDDLVAQKHWSSSGFASTDLDVLLDRECIHKPIIIGPGANPYLASAVQFGAELGYNTTLLKDVTPSHNRDGNSSTLEFHASGDATAVRAAAEIISILSTNNFDAKTFQAST
jgi:ureidoacrylate peracid hydrolase